MKRNYKMGLLALTISSVLSGCGDDSVDTSTPAPSTYQAPIANNVALSGDALTGSTITGEYDYLDPNFIPRDEGASVYNWKVDNKDNDLTNDPSVGNMRTLLLSDANVNQHLYFCIKPVAKASSSDPDKTKEKITGEEQCSTAKQVSSANGTKPYATSVALKTTSGLTVGDLVEGTYDYADDDSDAESGSSFRWRANGNDITGAKSQTHTLTNQQEGKSVEFCVTPQSANPDSITNYPTIGDEVCTNVDTNVILPLLGDSPVSTVPTITGEHTVGKTLTAAYIFSDNDNDLEGTSTFSWKRDGAEVGTALTYDLVSSDVGTNITFTVTPIAKTGLPVNGTPVTSIAITDVKLATGGVPSISIAPIGKSDSDFPKVGDTLTGNYTYTATSSGSADDSTVTWKLNTTPISSITCDKQTACDLPILEAYLGKSLEYCVTPKAIDSSSGTEKCSPVETIYGVRISGSLTLGSTLTAETFGYKNPAIEWKVDTSTTEGPKNDTAGNRTVKSTSDSFLIGDEVFKKIIDTDSGIDLDTELGNKNGIVDDADWQKAVNDAKFDVTTTNAAHYVGKDIELVLTTVEEGAVSVLASAQTTIKGGVYYDETDATKRAIEPTREVTFTRYSATAIYHRPLSVAEVKLKELVGFGKGLLPNNYYRESNGIKWAAFKMKLNDTYPGLTACLKLYDDQTWNLPASRYDGSYVPNGYSAQGNNSTGDNDNKNVLLIKFTNTANAANGLVGNILANEYTSPIFGWPTRGGHDGSTDKITSYWSSTTSGVQNPVTTTNAVKFYSNGSSGNNGVGNGQFVSCVKG